MYRISYFAENVSRLLSINIPLSNILSTCPLHCSGLVDNLSFVGNYETVEHEAWISIRSFGLFYDAIFDVSYTLHCPELRSRTRRNRNVCIFAVLRKEKSCYLCRRNRYSIPSSNSRPSIIFNNLFDILDLCRPSNLLIAAFCNFSSRLKLVSFEELCLNHHSPFDIFRLDCVIFSRFSGKTCYFLLSIYSNFWFYRMFLFFRYKLRQILRNLVSAL